jgi:hypothetical protein
MVQFNFTTNIEKRMPDTGKVFCIDRMTSDYAQAHPLDVDAFIESVYQEFAGTEFEESREVLRSVWTSVLSVTSPCGDASLYPNKNGQHRAAAMKVWHKAGDYWRRGLRLGDTLPDMVPMTKITRLNDGAWIALFPKDEHLLNDSALNDSCVPLVASDQRSSAAAEPAATPVQEAPAEPAVTEPVRNQSEPQQLDLFAFQQLQQENEHLHLQLSQQQAQPRPRRQRQPRKPAAVRQSNSVCPAIPLQEDNHDRQNLLKAIGMVAAATVALIVIYETGLLIPLGLIGLATGGILK